MGEVWEDGTNKISYGRFRDFLFGQTHDNIMGYPFQRAISGWLCRQLSTWDFHNQLEQIRENYPLPALYSNMNLISSHDIPRAITTFAGQPDPGNCEAQAHLRLSGEARAYGERLLVLAMAFQVGFPGTTAIYYGDEIGMEGYRDPFNRRTFEWGHHKERLQAQFRKLGCLKRDLNVLRTGDYRCLLIGEDHFVLERRLDEQGYDVFGECQDGPRSAIVAINRGATPITLYLSGREHTLQAYDALFLIDGDVEYQLSH